MLFQDRVFIVTGGSSGIGAAVSRALVGRGARVVLAARRGEVLQSVVASMLRPERALVVPTDVARHADLVHLVDAAMAHFGAIDGVVHCAGIGVTAHLEASSPDDLEDLVRVNLLAPMWLTRLALPALRARPGSVIVLVSSMSAIVRPPLQAAYVASKDGLVSFAEVLRRDLDGTGVEVVAVYPGLVNTPMNADIREAQARIALASPVPSQEADEAADEIVEAIARPRRELILGGWKNRLVAVLARRFPWLMGALLRRMRPDIERLATAEASVRAERASSITPR